MNNEEQERLRFLLKKNHGRLEQERLLRHLDESGIVDVAIYDFEESNTVIELMRCKNILEENSEMTYGVFIQKIKRILEEESTSNFLWTRQSEYCGLFKLQQKLTIENIISILEDTYFGGYFTIYFMESMRRLDADIDESPTQCNHWYYSYVFSEVMREG